MSRSGLVAAFSIALVLAGPADSARLIRQMYVPPNAESRVAALQHHFGPRSRAFIATEAAALVNSGHVSAGQIRTAISTAGFGQLSNYDVDALVAAVLAQCAEDVQNDLSDQLAALQAATKQKQAQRSQQQAMKASQARMRAQIRAQYTLETLSNGRWSARINQFNGQLAQVGDLDSALQAKIQEAQQLLAQILELLSSAFKDMDASSGAIISNLK